VDGALLVHDQSCVFIAPEGGILVGFYVLVQGANRTVEIMRWSESYAAEIDGRFVLVFKYEFTIQVYI
jgi:hypothetical protein